MQPINIEEKIYLAFALDAYDQNAGEFLLSVFKVNIGETILDNEEFKEKLAYMYGEYEITSIATSSDEQKTKILLSAEDGLFTVYVNSIDYYEPFSLSDNHLTA